MPSKPFQRKLRALGYGAWNSFKSTKIEDIQTLIIWLEGHKIRQYKVEDRKNLKNTKSPQWQSRYLNDYLIELEAPFRTKQKMNQDDWTELIEYFISQAIIREYSDSKGMFNKRQPIRRRDKISYSLKGCKTKECSKALEELCKFLNIPVNPSISVSCESLFHFIKMKFSLDNIKNFESSFKNKQFIEDPWYSIAGQKDILKYYGQYLQFSTNNPKLDAALIVLNILYILDTKQLQSQLNEIVLFLQKYTANPKTNTKLGKTGW